MDPEIIPIPAPEGHATHDTMPFKQYAQQLNFAYVAALRENPATAWDAMAKLSLVLGPRVVS